MAYDTSKLVKLAALKELAEKVSEDYVAQSSLASILFTTLAEASEAGTFDGASAYEVAVSNGYTGTEAEWLESLKGDPYTLTDDDKNEIAELVLSMVTDGDEVSY